MSSSKKIEIIIVGGGSGARLARILSPSLDSSKHNLSLVSTLPFAVHYLATARMVTTSEGNLESTTSGGLIPYDKVFEPGTPGRFVQGRAVAVDDKAKVVVLQSQERLAYDYLILATGSTWNGPLSFAELNSEREVFAHVNEWRAKIAKSKKIVIAGGGAVGIELAGEIKNFFPSTDVTLLQASPQLLNDVYTSKFRDYALAKVKSAGINVVLDDRLDIPPEGLFSEAGLSCTTSKGVEIDANLFIPMTGPRPNTACLAEFAGGSALSPGGRVKVAPTLNVQPSPSSVLPNVWAIGDIIEWNEQHQFMKANNHIEVVKKNLLATLASDDGSGKGPVSLAEYKSMDEAILVSVGPKGGFAYLPFLWGITLGDWFVGWVKSSGLFVSMARKSRGY
ncbi:FAD/NAD(P)-binding domain-containing protein [Clavulina sp. PMI_390]|nr:FAD/NAD(P)-binding domain-containing protein [Clavulina sp. PMI_390]